MPKVSQHPDANGLPLTQGTVVNFNFAGEKRLGRVVRLGYKNVEVIPTSNNLTEGDSFEVIKVAYTDVEKYL